MLWSKMVCVICLRRANDEWRNERGTSDGVDNVSGHNESDGTSFERTVGDKLNLIFLFMHGMDNCVQRERGDEN